MNTLSVSEVSKLVKEQVTRKVIVRGELTNVSRPSSGHIYCTLMDAEETSRARGPQLSLVFWRSTAQKHKAELKQGQVLTVEGELTTYAPRSSYQLIGKRLVEIDNQGELSTAYDQLHAKLAKEGLFEKAKKRELPLFPQCIGLVTSENGAALKDFLTTLRGRVIGEVLLVGSKVQGKGASEDLVKAITRLQKEACDVIVVTRGGGSDEDLWCFNEEPVVRAVSSSKTPIVSAVGHERDFTLCDFAADARASTPTAAAKLVAQESVQIASETEAISKKLLRRAKQRLKQLENRIIDSYLLPAQRQLKEKRDLLRTTGAVLDALSPTKTLEKGFCLAFDSEGKVIRNGKDLDLNQAFFLEFQDCVVSAKRITGHDLRRSR